MPRKDWLVTMAAIVSLSLAIGADNCESARAARISRISRPATRLPGLSVVAVIGAASTLIFGLAPAWRASAVSPEPDFAGEASEAITQNRRASAVGGGSGWIQLHGTLHRRAAAADLQRLTNLDVGFVDWTFLCQRKPTGHGPASQKTRSLTCRLKCVWSRAMPGLADFSRPCGKNACPTTSYY
jgi:hypothetical protein